MSHSIFANEFLFLLNNWFLCAHLLMQKSSRV